MNTLPTTTTANYDLGVVGSGNRNFNEQYCLTARRYARDYGFEMIDDYELRGTTKDCERIYANMAERVEEEINV